MEIYYLSSTGNYFVVTKDIVEKISRKLTALASVTTEAFGLIGTAMPAESKH
jgi:hypothetical protein